MSRDVWVFGYGSLIWRPAFAHEESQPAHIRGYVRRFWQGSTDHRGTPEEPGRVVTLVEQPEGLCHGVAYRVGPRQRDAVLAQLDYREKGGYRRLEVGLHLRRGDTVTGLVYIATEDNPNYVGPAPIEDIAEIVRRRRGPSGSNREYVVRLARALESLDARDEHVATLADFLDR